MIRPAKETLSDARRYFPLRGVHALVSIGTVVILARVMAPELYGTYVILLAWSAVLSTCVFNWVTAASFRFYQEAQFADQLSDLYRNLISCYLLMAGAWIVVGIAVVGMIIKADVDVSVTAVGWLILLGLVEPVVLMYQNIRMAARQIRSVGFVLLADTLLRGVLGVGGALVSDDKVAGVLAGQFAASALVATTLAFRVRSHVQFRHARIDKGKLWSFISYGYPMAGITLSSWVLSVSDRMILGWLAGPAAAGVYAVGYQLASNAILFPSASLMSGAFPVLIREHEIGGSGAAADLLRRLLVVAIIGGTTIVLFMSFASHALVETLFGSSYAAAATLIPIVAAGHLLMAISEYFAKGFQLAKRTAGLFQITLLAAIVNVVANVALIPLFGIMGAALSTIVSYGFALALTASGCQRFLPVRVPGGSLIKIGVAIVVPLLGLLWFWPVRGFGAIPAGVAAMVGAFLFLATLWGTREPVAVEGIRVLVGSLKSWSPLRSES